METQTLHFRVGADMGITLMQIASEHFLYENNIDKALSVFNDSFGGGCPEELQLALLKGDKLILVDEEEQTFVVVDRSEYMHLDSIYPKVDFVKHFKEKRIQMDKHCSDLTESLDMLVSKFRYRSSYRMEFSTEAVLKFIYGNDEDLIEELQEDEELNQMRFLIKIIREFIETSFKLAELSRKINNLYNLDISFDAGKVMTLAQKVQGLATQDFGLFLEEVEDNVLSGYLEASRDIDEVLSKGIEPVDIMSNYSAGWLSPEGKYYALNGEIANMLHNQIADALQEAGIIPADKDDNPDVWLEQAGWVKIHDNNVQFAGCLNHRISKTNVHMTDIQKKMIYEYIALCHSGIVRLGWKMTKVSAARFQMTDDLMLAKNYFEF